MSASASGRRVGSLVQPKSEPVFVFVFVFVFVLVLVLVCIFLRARLRERQIVFQPVCGRDLWISIAQPDEGMSGCGFARPLARSLNHRHLSSSRRRRPAARSADRTCCARARPANARRPNMQIRRQRSRGAARGRRKEERASLRKQLARICSPRSLVALVV